MRRFTLTIACDGAAFDPEPSSEIARILRSTAYTVAAGVDSSAVLDVNGNRIGTFKLDWS